MNNILLIDDNANILAMLNAFLCKYYNVKETIDARVVLRLIKQKILDLIITDWTLLGISGIDITSQVRNNLST